MSNHAGNPRAGEAGHEGYDRQPGSAKGKPEASPAEVKSRSKEASFLKQPKHQCKDHVHPGPERDESEKSKGDAHHDQHEKERIMDAEDL